MSALYDQAWVEAHNREAYSPSITCYGACAAPSTNPIAGAARQLTREDVRQPLRPRAAAIGGNQTSTQLQLSTN